MADIRRYVRSKIQLFACLTVLCGSAVSADAQLLSPLMGNNPPAASAQNKPVLPRAAEQAARPAPTPAQPRPNLQTTKPAGQITPEETPEQPDRIIKFRFVGNDIVFEDEPAIMLYMKNFRISKDIKGIPNCSMDFYILSSAKEKITAISYQLKWPDMKTVVSFDDVMPQTPTFHAYTLLGEGCRNMDQAPNIIVNRCRIKGMTSQECADAIQWMN